MLGVWMLSVSMIILFDFRIVPTMWYFLFSILLYRVYFGIYWFSLRLVDDDIFTFPGFTSRSLFVLIQAFVLIVPVVFMLYLYICLFIVPSMLVLSTCINIIPNLRLRLDSTSVCTNNDSVSFLLSSSASEN